ncbi:EF-hand domain-containing protein 1-like [Aphis craccivora]|uniref:EF-hand domain-containing protein 1-like n=1 Tax=Aphis craccivora TaxID=307492 RepID=A0A6G0YFE7_APHCR|nr:EF-hand domain-containing protein 1-like [Aphis craccivora]
MDGLPFIPGFRFTDITKKDYHLSSQFRWKNGYAIPKDKPTGIGKAPLDVDCMLYSKTLGTTGYNPTLTYGQAKDPPKPIVQPHFIMFDGKCLSFNGFTQQPITESAVDTFRVRRVKITYFLVDDSISVVEPIVENAGYVQGCLLKRGQIPNPHRKNKNWHWSDLNNGVELSFYGVVYKLCNCDSFTRQFLSSQGVEVDVDKPVPDDPYMSARREQLLQQKKQQSKTLALKSGFCSRSIEDDKLKQFLENDGKVLRFYTAWLDEGYEPVEWKFFVLLYFLAYDRIEIYESRNMGNTCGQNSFPLFLGKIKLPKDWSDLPPNFPSIYLEPGNKECKEYYQPKDFIIGHTIFVMGRRFLLYDCDPFTRDYFKDILQIIQPDSIQMFKPKDNFPTVSKLVIPPHTGIGDPDDTRQNCLSLIPKAPKTLDFVTYVLNASKKLRYKLKMVPVYEVDNLRDFIMEYCLGNDQMTIVELASKNSGFIKGRFMSSTRLRKPGTNVDEDQFYGTKDFAIGAKLHVRGSVFIIVELDLWTYNYMNENKDKFTQEAIEKAKCYLENKGLLIIQQKPDVINQNSITRDISKSDQIESPEDTIMINIINQSNINI